MKSNQGVLLGQDHKRIAGTVELFRRHRAHRHHTDAMTGITVEKRLHRLLDIAINRKAGIPDDFPSEMYRVHAEEVVRVADRVRRDDPELPVRYGHFSAPMRRALAALVGRHGHGRHSDIRDTRDGAARRSYA